MRNLASLCLVIAKILHTQKHLSLLATLQISTIFTQSETDDTWQKVRNFAATLLYYMEAAQFLHIHTREPLTLPRNRLQGHRYPPRLKVAAPPRPEIPGNIHSQKIRKILAPKICEKKICVFLIG